MLFQRCFPPSAKPQADRFPFVNGKEPILFKNTHLSYQR